MTRCRVRAEGRDDIAAIRRVVTAAFGQPGEARLVDELRQAGDLEASSVAIIEGEVVGHAALSRGTIRDTTVLILAPVAVDPTFPRRGIGTAVVSHVLASNGGPVVVLGDPSYYGRFGFEPADDHRINDPTFNPPPGMLQVLRPELAPQGTLTYPDAFLHL